jgi:hypothetical protein
MDESLRRRLRFSFVLQVVGALMMGIAAIVRLSAFGLDAITAVLLGAALLIGAIAVVTGVQIRRLSGTTGAS